MIGLQFTDYNFLERLRNYLFRCQIRQVLDQKPEIDNSCAGDLVEIDAELIWSKIANNLATEEKDFRRPRPEKISWFVGLGLMSAIAALALFFLPQTSSKVDFAGSTNAGIKGDISNEFDFSLMNFRFAVARKDGTIEPGVPNMVLPAGSAIVFSTETTETPPTKGFKVRLEVTTEDQNKIIIIDSYSITKKKEVFRNDSGYIAYTPTTSGILEFTLNLDPAHEGTKNVKRFQVTAAKP